MNRTTSTCNMGLIVPTLLAALVIPACGPAGEELAQGERPAPTTQPSTMDAQTTAFMNLKATSTQPVELMVERGYPRSVTGLFVASGETQVDRARNFLTSQAELFRHEGEGLTLEFVHATEEGVRYAQRYQGLPVFGASISVSVRGRYVSGVVARALTRGAQVDLTPALDNLQAETTALEYLKSEKGTAIGVTSLGVYDLGMATGETTDLRLAWRVSILGEATVLVDAHSGEILKVNGKVQEANFTDFDLQIEDAFGGDSISCWIFADTDTAATEDGIESDWANDPQIKQMNSLAWDTYGFYYDEFSMNSYDDDGEQYEIYAHWGQDNASYSSDCDTFQFGDRRLSPDIAAHEVGHAIIAEYSELEYHKESGALNESFADLMGFLRDGNFIMGEASVAGAIRDLANPPAFSDPDTYANRITPPDTQAGDWGGVHTNSGISNKAHTLLVTGGVHNGQQVKAIGKTRVKWLVWAEMRNLADQAQMIDARNYSVNVATGWASDATHGYSSADVCAVRNAWAAVGRGVGDVDCDGVNDDQETDPDNDGIASKFDNCTNTPNVSQKDLDGDGLGDICDTDLDGDGIPNLNDNCAKANPDQADLDNNGVGDTCQDNDNDGVRDDLDNCPTDANADQKDNNGDGIGNACDGDMDFDNLWGGDDLCPFTYDPSNTDKDNDGVGDVCDPCLGVYSPATAWTTGWGGMTPKPIFADQDKDGTPDACDSDPYGNEMVVIFDGGFAGKGLSVDGSTHTVDIGGMVGGVVMVPLATCVARDCAVIDPDKFVEVVVVGLPGTVGMRVVDETGRTVAKAQQAEREGDKGLRFQPKGGRQYFVQMAVLSDMKSPASFDLSAVKY